MSNHPVIGIVGGVGPYAGIDLARKVFDQTLASSDQDHLPVALLSFPERIVDRTEYLLGRTDENPAYTIAEIIRQLEGMGASVVGIPCNTAHAPAIFDVILDELDSAGSSAKLLHMVEETAAFLRRHYPQITSVGLLSTLGTAKAGGYDAALRKEGLEPVMPGPVLQQSIHDALYNPKTGIKAQANPVTAEAKGVLMDAVRAFRERGVQAVLLGCTEIPLAITERMIDDTVILDPTLILARALIREANPEKLRPLEEG